MRTDNIIDYTNEALAKTCRVLIALHDDGPMTSNQIADLVGLKCDEVSSICSYLCAKGKVARQNELSKTGYIWEAVAEPEINLRPKHVERLPRSNGACTSDVKARLKKDSKIRRTFISVKFREQKIELLKIMLAKLDLSPNQKDLLVGMIADYELRGEYNEPNN